MSRYIFYHVEDLDNYIIRFFEKLGVSHADAAIASDVLLAADLRGVESHGLIRLHTYYGSRLQNGTIDPASPISIVKETPATLLLDGGKGLGQVVSHTAMTRAIEKAEQTGVAIVSVRNSNHYGIAGYYAMMALPHDMIGISFTNAQPLVAPTHGRTPLLGTNPIAVAVPSATQRPFVLDMATSIVPIGKITVYDKAKKEIPAGWGINKSGEVTQSPAEVLNGGALLPLGGTELLRGYKGYGLAMMVDIFSGVLSGAAFGGDVGRPRENKGANVGHFFAAIKIDAFRPLDEFKQDMDALLLQMKNAPKAGGEERIYIHGEKEFELAEYHRQQGVPLMDEVVKSLKEAGEKIGVEFNLHPMSEKEGSEL